MKPLRIQLQPEDNVAIVVNEGGLPTGTVFDDGLTLVEHVPEAHKVALVDLPKGSPVTRYGVTIGTTNADVPRGAWVHEGLMEEPAAPSLQDAPFGGAPVPDMSPLEGITFQGYRNADGTVGTRNILAISTTVQCVSATVDYAVKRIKQDLLPKYPNVDDVIAITHNYGCGIAFYAPGSEIPIRTLRNLALNPNLGGAPMVVSLGCEKMQPSSMLPASTLPVLQQAPYVVTLQDEEHHGFMEIVSAILEMADKRLEELNRRTRVTCPASDLVVGMQCGGSDAFSGVTANPAVGYASDLLVRAGATVMFSEVTEVRDGIHMLTARAANDDVARALIREMQWYDDYLAHGGMDRSANPTPGNKAGGLNNIVEKAMGSIAKSGRSQIHGVLGPGERASTKGLLFAATPASDFVCGTLQLAAGMNMHVFTTGRGTPYGLAMAPVIKLSTRSPLARRWHDLIDIDAGTIATGEETIAQVGERIFQMILDTASGKHTTWADHYGLHNEFALFNPAPIT
ncbi:galactarate dehydratase [Terriglobus roseus]|uniref:Galactarate dehydratase n=1 Tax=Terriglobus roseus TaxID=392734 RepID=A0A1G7Q9P2_9BACT|nr:galactarate dehydratase [Terriglobus roseus]SDF95165.1 galactarate dehydratase [Terriglobus roseus]